MRFYFRTYRKYFLASNESSKSSSILTTICGLRASNRRFRSSSVKVLKSSGNCNDLNNSIYNLRTWNRLTRAKIWCRNLHGWFVLVHGIECWSLNHLVERPWLDNFGNIRADVFLLRLLWLMTHSGFEDIYMVNTVIMKVLTFHTNV